MNAVDVTMQHQMTAELSRALDVPNVSAHTHMAGVVAQNRAALDMAERLIADVRERRALVSAEALRRKEVALVAHRQDQDATLSRDSAEVERLEEQLAAARARFSTNAKAFQDGRTAIITDCQRDEEIALSALQEEEASALMSKAMAEAALAAAAKVAA